MEVGLVSNLGNGHQIQFKTTVEQGATKEEINAIFDVAVDAAKRQVARVNLPTIKAKLEIVKSRVIAHKEMIALIDNSLEESKKNVRVNGAGKVFTIDAKSLDEQAAKRHNADMELIKLETELTLTESELAETLKEAE